MTSMLRSSRKLWLLCHRSSLLSGHVRSTCNSSLLFRERLRPRFTLPTSTLKTSSFHLQNKAEKAFSVSSRHNTEGVKASLSVSLNNVLRRIDDSIQKKKRISQGEFQRVFEMIKTIGKATGPEGLLLIRCCGLFIPEMKPEKRLQLEEEVWQTLLDLKCPLDISHYNALLTVYLENEHTFNPIDFLSNLEQQGLEPNRVTYHRLVSRYCQKGEIEGASKLLEFMKVKEIPVNEEMFNELIKGHAYGNNMEDAKKIIDVMRSSALTPSSSTWSALACGYAKAGDIESVLTTIQEAIAEEVYIKHEDILQIVYTLAVNNHGHLIDNVLPHLKHGRGYTNDCMNLCLELINRGYHEVAFSLLKTLPTGTLPNGAVAPTGLFFLRQIIKENLPINVIIDYCNRLVEAGQNENAFLNALQFAHESSNSELAIALLKELQAADHNLRPHYFWPVLVSRRRSDEGLCDVLKLMVDLKCNVDSDTIKDYVYPFFSVNDPQAVITKLEEIGCELKQVVEAIVVCALQNYNSEAAVDILAKYPIAIQSPALLVSALAFAYIETKDVSSTLQILEYCKANNVTSADVYHMFLTKLGLNNVDPVVMKPLVNAMKEQGVQISSATAEAVSKRLWPLGNSDPSVQLNSLVNADYPSPPSERQMRQTTGYSDWKEKFASATRSRDLEAVEEIMLELDNNNYNYGAQDYVALIGVYRYHNDCDKATYFKNQLDSRFPDFRIRDMSLILLAKLMVDNKKFDDAINLIKKHHSKFGKVEDQNQTLIGVRRLLHSFATSEESLRTQEVFQMLVSFGYCTPTVSFLSPLIKSYLTRNDTSGAVEEYIKLTQTYQCCPAKYDIFKHLVELADSESLQKVVDASINVDEEGLVLLTLARSFIDCGQLKQAKKVLETPGLRVNSVNVEMACEMYLKNNMINELELFVQATKSVFGMDRERMYHYLLKGYVNAENVEKALGVWLKIQDENLLPSNSTLYLLGTFLQRMNQPVPFIIPPLPRDDYERNSQERFSNQRQNDDFNRNPRERLSSQRRNNEDLEGRDDVSLQIELLVKNQRLEEALEFINKSLDEERFLKQSAVHYLGKALSDAGCTDDLLNLQKRIPWVNQRKFQNFIDLSNLNDSKADEILTSLETEDAANRPNFPGSTILKILEQNPSKIDRVKNIVEVYFSEGKSHPRNVLWIHYMRKKMFDEADRIYQATPQLSSHLLFNSLLKAVMVEKDVELSKKLVNLMSESQIPNQLKSRIYSCHLEVLCSVNKTDEALNFVKDLQKIFPLEQLSPKVLLILKSLFRTQTTAIPLAVSMGIQEASSSARSSSPRSSSSSSDSSDSD